MLEFNFDRHARGKGFWKFNVSHLRDPRFLEEMNILIDQYVWSVKEDINPAQIWEYLKLEITTFCVEFSIRKAKQRNMLIEKLESKIKLLEE